MKHEAKFAIFQVWGKDDHELYMSRVEEGKPLMTMEEAEKMKEYLLTHVPPKNNLHLVVEPLHSKKAEGGPTGKKTIMVTEKNIAEFEPYRETKKKLAVGEVLYVISEHHPYVRKNAEFAIVTDWEPNDNSLRMIAREHDPQ